MEMVYSIAPNDSAWYKHWKDINDELKLDEEIEPWFLMGSFWPILAILLLYFQFIFKTGPNMMKNRPPFKLKGIIIIYNIFQIILNASIVYYSAFMPGFITYIWRESCNPDVVPTSPQETEYLYFFKLGSWWYLIAKVLDLLDTVFFVLRKKQSHVSFLHVYHHTSMIHLVWFGFKYIRPLHTCFPGVLNCLIHVIMYSYYLVSILIPGIGRKNLLIKAIITRLQIVQFIMILGHTLVVYRSCPVPRSVIYIELFHVTMFLVLFINFYTKEYTSGNKQKSEITETETETKKMS